MRQNFDVIDKIAMGISGALMILGIVVLGIVEILAGKPFGAAPLEQTNDAGEVINTLYPAVDPNIRTGLVLAGVLVLFIWGLYRMFTPQIEGEESVERTEMTA